MIGSALATRFVFQFSCPLCEESVVLPRESPLGTYEGQRYLTKGMWPINFLCFRHKQVSVCSPDIRLETMFVLSQQINLAALWEIVSECGRENCGRHHAIYTKYLEDATPQDVIDILLEATTAVPCTGNHSIQLSSDHSTAQKLDF